MSRDLGNQYRRALDIEATAERKMRRAFNQWVKAKKARERCERRLEDDMKQRAELDRTGQDVDPNDSV